MHLWAEAVATRDPHNFIYQFTHLSIRTLRTNLRVRLVFHVKLTRSVPNIQIFQKIKCSKFITIWPQDRAVTEVFLMFVSSKIVIQSKHILISSILTQEQWSKIFNMCNSTLIITWLTAFTPAQSVPSLFCLDTTNTPTLDNGETAKF